MDDVNSKKSFRQFWKKIYHDQVLLPTNYIVCCIEIITAHSIYTKICTLRFTLVLSAYPPLLPYRHSIKAFWFFDKTFKMLAFLVTLLIISSVQSQCPTDFVYSQLFDRYAWLIFIILLQLLPIQCHCHKVRHSWRCLCISWSTSSFDPKSWRKCTNSSIGSWNSYNLPDRLDCLVLDQFGVDWSYNLQLFQFCS